MSIQATESSFEFINKTQTDLYAVMEHFYTIQGEGRFTGQAAYFIRLGGCDVGCHWCDVKESWDIDKHPKSTAEEISRWTIPSSARLVVITGGEPLMYDLTHLTQELHELGKVINIETSGAYPISGSIDWICLSPKKFKSPLPEVSGKADELKVIIYNKSDFKWAEEHAESVSDECALFLQPEWSVREKVTPLIIDYVKEHPKWQISLQTHKYLDIP